VSYSYQIRGSCQKLLTLINVPTAFRQLLIGIKNVELIISISYQPHISNVGHAPTWAVLFSRENSHYFLNHKDFGEEGTSL